MRGFLVGLKNKFIKKSATITVEHMDRHTELLEELNQLKLKLSSVNQELVELEYVRYKLINEIENKILQNNCNKE